MNILYLTNHINIGGITSYVLTLSKGLKARGHNVYVASSGGIVLPEFLEAKITYIPIPIRTKSEICPKILFSLFKLSSAARKYKIDIAHSNSRTTQVLACQLDRFFGIRHVSTCHGFFKQRISRRIFPCWGRKVIAISEPVKEHLINDFKVAQKDIAVVHNGIDTRRFKLKRGESGDSIRKRFNLTDGDLLAGIVARLSDVKGHRFLIEAMRRVLDKMPNAKLLIVGEGKISGELIELAKSLGLEKDVFFMPEVCDTADVLSAMDVFVMPSLQEGLGLALMEAMACGLAVIGSCVGGIKSLIQDGHNGLLVKPADVEGLSEAILDLFRNPGKREALGKNAAMFINENFSQEKMIIQTEGVYQECVNAGP